MNFLKLGRIQNAFLFGNLTRANGQTQMLAARPISVSSPLQQQQGQAEQKGGKKKWVIGALIVGAGALWYFTRGKKGDAKPAMVAKKEDGKCQPRK